MNLNNTIQAAKDLLGCTLVHVTPEGLTSGIIIETEAYLQDDKASHSYNGLTNRNARMYGKPGTAYIYFTYGMHHCMNVVTNKRGVGEAVLIRALKPTEGVTLMRDRRGREEHLCDGPAKLVQAMGITKDLNGHDLLKKPLFIIPRKKTPLIQSSTRIGISKGRDQQYRFFIPK